MATNPLNPKVLKNLKTIAVTPKVGDTVLVTKKDGTQFLAEIVEISDKIKNLITKVKKVDDDGTVTVEEVSDLVVEAVILVKDIVLSDIWKVIGQFFKNLFRKKQK